MTQCLENSRNHDPMTWNAPGCCRRCHRNHDLCQASMGKESNTSRTAPACFFTCMRVSVNLRATLLCIGPQHRIKIWKRKWSYGSDGHNFKQALNMQSFKPQSKNEAMAQMGRTSWCLDKGLPPQSSDAKPHSIGTASVKGEFVGMVCEACCQHTVLNTTTIFKHHEPEWGDMHTCMLVHTQLIIEASHQSRHAWHAYEAEQQRMLRAGVMQRVVESISCQRWKYRHGACGTRATHVIFEPFVSS